ncbi:hypothetical protein NQ314_002166 [Rhamnusium bicolor]|uniref:Uncharacterized protein n=1 Tax=Rhamnusium bicolor TaxID=1586634 RepID=A0AAV8ZS22_9CUCU|nr:hypothetical protein NQ314_002166 [Rhamnusium bicolor]
MQKIRQQYEEILTSLEDKENRIVDLEFELLSVQKEDSKADISILEKGDSGSEKHSSYYRQEIEEKDKEIEKLSVELKKCTCYLQEIVNTELWDRNKEIEKLHNKHANSSEIMKLRKDLIGKELQLKLLKEKISELGLDISIPSEESFDTKDLLSPSKNIQHIKALQEQLKTCKEERDYFKGKVEEVEGNANHTNEIEALQSQNKILQKEIENSEKLRHESNEICSVLSGRLEELAIFLDSLLKQKSVLGFLGVHKNRKLREIIDNSLDLSRSFTMSMMINPDQSLAQLSNITTLLNGSVFQDLTLDLPHEEEETQSVLSIVPTNVTLTYQSHLYKQNKGSEPNNEQVISTLREQIVNLKSELQLRDNELNRLNNLNNKELSDKSTETDDEGPNKSFSGFKDVSKLFMTPVKCATTSTTLKYQSDCHSESESWSEPDRVISRARIGLSQTLPVSMKHKKTYINESTEEESGGSLSPQKKYFNEDEEDPPLDIRQHILNQHESLQRVTADLLNAEERLLYHNNTHKELVDDLKRKLDEAEDKYVKAEANKNDIEDQVKALQQNVDELVSIKKNLEESMAVKDKETQNRINQLEVEKEEASRIAQNYEREAIEAKNEFKAAETKLKQMQEELYSLEGNLRKEYEQYTIVKLKDAEEEFVKKLREVEEKAEHKVMQIRDKVSSEFVPRCEFEKKIVELESLVNELDNLKSVVKSYEETIQAYKEKESGMKVRLQEYQDKINGLHKELDNTTLQYSGAVLQKTKLANEKTLLEQELSKMNIKGSDMKQQFSDIQIEFANVNQNHQQHISSLQKQKSKLEVKISELESANAELHNRLVKLQANRADFNSSLPNIGSRKVHVMAFRRQYSDQNYSSEENIEERGDFNFNRPLIPNIQPVDIERHEANSSPDLGIESDHGRFSSLETHATVQRPLLQTIELTESMSNLLDGENNQVESVTCGKSLKNALSLFSH